MSPRTLVAPHLPHNAGQAPISSREIGACPALLSRIARDISDAGTPRPRRPQTAPPLPAASRRRDLSLTTTIPPAPGEAEGWDGSDGRLRTDGRGVTSIDSCRPPETNARASSASHFTANGAHKGPATARTPLVKRFQRMGDEARQRPSVRIATPGCGV